MSLDDYITRTARAVIHGVIARTERRAHVAATLQARGKAGRISGADLDRMCCDEPTPGSRAWIAQRAADFERTKR